jgi:hypothetical protein
MNCPHCGADLELAVCPHCGAETLPAGKFCCQCGARLEVETELPPDLANRVLCPDGACIGILNDQGKCSVCGFAYKAVSAGEQAHG